MREFYEDHAIMEIPLEGDCPQSPQAVEQLLTAADPHLDNFSSFCFVLTKVEL